MGVSGIMRKYRRGVEDSSGGKLFNFLASQRPVTPGVGETSLMLVGGHGSLLAMGVRTTKANNDQVMLV